MPRDHVERRVIHARDPQPARRLGDQLATRIEVFVARTRGLEIPRIGEPVGPDGAKLGQPQWAAEFSEHNPAHGTFGKIDPEPQAARDHGDLLRFDAKPS